MQGSVYLIPNIISESSNPKDVLPNEVFNKIKIIKHFIVEDLRSARRFLKKLDNDIIIDELKFYLLNKQTDNHTATDFLMPAINGFDIGIISEAGTPCVADPGNIIVENAHNFNIKVVPLVGPSSILLALMASGMNGQNFAFNGYLPIDKRQKTNAIKNLESKSLIENQSQIFMETPYRNNQILSDILKVCKGNTKLCIAMNITGKNEFIKTMTIAEWKKYVPELNKQPSIFIIQAV